VVRRIFKVNLSSQDGAHLSTVPDVVFPSIVARSNEGECNLAYYNSMTQTQKSARQSVLIPVRLAKRVRVLAKSYTASGEGLCLLRRLPSPGCLSQRIAETSLLYTSAVNFGKPKYLHWPHDGRG
jgi:hypothetical protein